MAETPDDARRKVRHYYDGVGWQGAEGTSVDSAVNLDPRVFSRLRSLRGKPAGFPAGGRRFLDAGCGANPRRGLAAGFGQHVCVDFSEVGLAKALQKLGGSAVGIVADLTDLPMDDGSFDAVSCENVLFHMVPSDQARAFRELYRVLSPGGQLWIGYTKGPHWPPEKVARCLRGLGRGILHPFRALAGRSRPPAAETLLYEPQPVRWWRDLLLRLGAQYRLAARPWLDSRWTRPLPLFLAVTMVRTMRLLCNRCPRAAFPLTQHYYIIVSKPD